MRMVEVVLSKEAFNMDDVDEEGNTLLHLAARHGNRKMCEVLIASGSTIKHNRQGHTPIDTARLHQHMDCVFILEPAAQRQAPATARVVDRLDQKRMKQGSLALLSQQGAVHWSASAWTHHYAAVRGTTMQLFRSKDAASSEGEQAALTLDLRRAQAFIPSVSMQASNADQYEGDFCITEYGRDASQHVCSCSPCTAP